MKTVNEYIDDNLSNLWKEKGAFFAFGQNQFDEKAQKGTKYVGLTMGLVCPQQNAGEVNAQMHKIIDAGIAQDIAENGIEAIITRELYNHEATYTWNIDSTVDALVGYSVTREQIQNVFNKLVK